MKDSMPNTVDLHHLAAQIVHAQDTQSTLRTFSSAGPPLSIHQAYQVSWLVHEQRLRQGWKPVGRKIGFTNKDMWTLFGVDQPVWSFVYDTTFEAVGAAFVCPLQPLVQPKIEPEIVLCLRAAPPLGANEGEVLDCVDWMAHGIEMVQCHYPDWAFTSTDAIADASFHGRLYVGDKQAVRGHRQDCKALLKTCEVALFRGPACIEVGHGHNVMGSPLLAVVSLIQALHREGSPYPIQPGEIITTGTLTKAHSVTAQEQWRTAFQQDSFAALTVDFV
jgi:2-keto-4-pentenoate hydratase